MLPNGNIAINDDFNDRVVVVDPEKQADRLAVRPSRCVPARGRDALKIPDGMDYVPLGAGRKAALAARPPPIAHEHTFA